MSNHDLREGKYMAETTSESTSDEVPHPIDTDYETGQHNITPFGLDIHNPVFLISGLSIMAFVLITLMFQEGATEFFGWLRPALRRHLIGSF